MIYKRLSLINKRPSVVKKRWLVILKKSWFTNGNWLSTKGCRLLAKYHWLSTKGCRDLQKVIDYSQKVIVVYKTLSSVTNGYRYEQNVIVIYTRLSLLRRKKSGFTKDCRPSSNGNRLLAKDCWLSTKGYLPFTKRSSGIDQSFALLAKDYRLSTKGYPYFQEVIGYQQKCIRYQQLWW